MSNEGRDFDTLRRYETTIERAWYRAIRELRAAQKERREYEAAQAEEEAYNPPLEDTMAKRHPSSPMANEVIHPRESHKQTQFPSVRNWDWLRFAKGIHTGVSLKKGSKFPRGLRKPSAQLLTQGQRPPVP